MRSDNPTANQFGSGPLRFLVTGGAGFIGSSVIRLLIRETAHEVLNLDKLTYSSSLSSLAVSEGNSMYRFVRGDICDRSLVERVFEEYQPHIVMHLAAESHVDRSIDGPAEFVQTNIVGTSVLLEAAREYWSKLPSSRRDAFRFHHVSTDEVFGSLPALGLFTERTPYDPSSPYSASKASSDHLVRAWQRTYGLPTLITNCSNNYGPYQFPEKLIPLVVLNAVERKPLPVYGDGRQVRDWLYVDDHARALVLVALKGAVGETYNIGGSSERSNLEVVHSICDYLQAQSPFRVSTGSVGNYRSLIKFVADRPGHDQRYAIDSSKIREDLGWLPLESFETGLQKTIDWYLNNLDWCADVQRGSFSRQRLGMNRTEVAG